MPTCDKDVLKLAGIEVEAFKNDDHPAVAIDDDNIVDDDDDDG